MNASAHIIYAGRVQGVGFRMTVQHQALNLALAGWVKNLPNGSVEILVEGPKEKITALCRDIEQRFESHIQNKDIRYDTELGHFKGFKIAY